LRFIFILSYSAGGKINHNLIAFFLVNISAKSYQNWFVYVEVTASHRCYVETWFILENDSV